MAHVRWEGWKYRTSGPLFSPDIIITMLRTTLRWMLVTVCFSVFFAGQAQVLFVNDNDNITYNTDTILNDLLAAGLEVDVYHVALEGMAPGADVLASYPTTIWYCSGDGLGLGLWQAEADLHDYVADGGALWMIGTDMLYAEYGGAPYTFETGEVPFDLMGVASYDLQSYGDDGGEGCPQMLSSVVAFEPTISWMFSTFWWADGVTPLEGTDVIYAMGPEGYALYGAPSMVHNRNAGMNVMSTYFDPALIGTFEARVLFLQQSMARLSLNTSVHAPAVPSTLELNSVEGIGVQVITDGDVFGVSMLNLAGQVVAQARVVASDRTLIDTRALPDGVYILTAVTRDGGRHSAKWLVR